MVSRKDAEHAKEEKGCEILAMGACKSLFHSTRALPEYQVLLASLAAWRDQRWMAINRKGRKE